MEQETWWQKVPCFLGSVVSHCRCGVAPVRKCYLPQCEGELSATDTCAGHSLWSSKLITVVGRGGGLRPVVQYIKV